MGEREKSKEIIKISGYHSLSPRWRGERSGVRGSRDKIMIIVVSLLSVGLLLKTFPELKA
jgi:hypothetical protein